MGRNYYGYELTDAKIQTSPAAVAVTFTDTGDVVGLTAHGYSDTDMVVFPSITTTTGLTANTTYYVRDSATDSFKVAATSGGSALTLTTNGTGTVRKIFETDLLYANQIEFSSDETTLTFEGDAQSRQLFITSGITASLRADCITVEAAEVIFSKTAVTANLPTGATRLTYFGELTETQGVSAGMWANALAIKEDTGVESIVTIRIWVPLGNLSLSGPPSLQTKQKAGQQTYRLSALRSSVGVAGQVLPATVPTGGAFYSILEL